MQDYLGPEIISHFVMHGPSVAEIIKYLITVLKKNENEDLPFLFLEALKMVRFSYLHTIMFPWCDAHGWCD